jgi:hypothetical protein
MLSEPQVVRAYFRLAIEKARDMKVVLALGYELSPGWSEILAQEAKRAGYVLQPGESQSIRIQRLSGW